MSLIKTKIKMMHRKYTLKGQYYANKNLKDIQKTYFKRPILCYIKINPNYIL